MSIYWGDFEEAFHAPIDRWQVYPFASFPNKKSFSDALFEALNLPAVRGEQLSSRITMHQLLRLMYVDQTTPHDHLFYGEAFDKAVMREAVGDLIAGVYDARLYELQFALRDARNVFANIERELRSVMAILGPDEQAIGVAVVAQTLHNRTSEREKAYARLQQLGAADGTASPDVGAEPKLLDSLRTDLAAQASSVEKTRKEIGQLSIAIEDSELFMNALESKIQALRESSTVSEVLGSAAFDVCPACFSPLAPAGDSDCRVCHKPYTADAHRKNAQRLRSEFQLQIEESRGLQEVRRAKLEQLLGRLPGEEAKRREVQDRLDELSVRALTRLESEQAELYRHVGYLDREIELLERKRQMAARVDALVARKADISSDISRMQDEIAARSAAQSERQAQATSSIASLTAEILRKDLPREEGFREATQVAFSFSTDDISVDGKKVFAASSMVLLKNAFHLALVLASTSDREFRYPRFALFDNIEDKGMEEERSHHFQRLVVDYSANAEGEHQIIFTTSKIAPELDVPDLTIGRHYKLSSKSLLL